MLEVQNIKRLLGNAQDPQNPLGFQGVLQADEQQTLSDAARDLSGLLAKLFVPQAWGGQLKSWPMLTQQMRRVFARDPALGLSVTASSLIATVNVWVAGSDQQKSQLAATLLQGKKVACLYHELNHGNDVSQTECHADLQALTLTGSKQVIANLNQAEMLLLFARTDPQQGSRSHTPLLIPIHTLPEHTLKWHDRYFTSGMKGILLGGCDFDGAPIQTEQLVGPVGSGMETALKSFQITRTVLPSMFVGVLDSGLRITMDFASQRQLYGRTVLEQPLTRSVLCLAQLDLLWCDLFTTVTTRALHLKPEQCSLYSAATKALVPHTLVAAMRTLTQILGASFYTRQGSCGMMQKLWRDLKPVGFGHASRLTCLMSILPQLPALARKGWQEVQPDRAWFDVQAPLPEPSFDRFRVTASGKDSLLPLLDLDVAFQNPELQHLSEAFRQQFHALRDACKALPPRDLGGVTAAEPYLLAERYCLLLAASSCIQMTLCNPNHLLNETLLLAMLQRLQDLLQGHPTVLSEQAEQHLWQHMMHAHLHHTPFEALTPHPLSQEVTP